jgi:GH24 family phage-related lysozyme (muramidase)
VARRENLARAIIDHEGDGLTDTINGEKRFFPYDDSDEELNDVVGRRGDLEEDCSIAWEENLTVNGISLQVAKKILNERIDEIENFLRQEFTFWHQIEKPRQNVLIEMVYHMGYGNFMQFKNMINALQDGDYEEATEQILDSKAGR